MKTKFGQKLDEDEVQAYTPNMNLQLTLSSEVNRLRKVIEEKDALIAKFKKYDEERKTYYRRFEQNYKIMEERFNEFLDAVKESDEISGERKEFYNLVVMRLYKGKVSADNNKSILQVAYSHLLKLKEHFDNMEWLVTSVGNARKRSELLEELRKMKVRYDNIVSSFVKKMKKLK